MKSCWRITALLLGILLLGGCRGAPGFKPDYQALVGETLARNYAFDATVSWQEQEATARVEKTDAQEIKISFSQPDTLKDLAVTLSGEEVTIHYRGMKMDLGMYDIPAQSILPVLWELLSEKAAKKLTVTEKEDTVEAAGSLYVTGFTITFEKETMKIQKIEVPDLQTVLTITQFEFL